jgi:hypothetical protein
LTHLCNCAPDTWDRVLRTTGTLVAHAISATTRGRAAHTVLKWNMQPFDNDAHHGVPCSGSRRSAQPCMNPALINMLSRHTMAQGCGLPCRLMAPPLSYPVLPWPALPIPASHACCIMQLHRPDTWPHSPRQPASELWLQACHTTFNGSCRLACVRHRRQRKHARLQQHAFGMTTPAAGCDSRQLHHTGCCMQQRSTPTAQCSQHGVACMATTCPTARGWPLLHALIPAEAC